AVRQPQQAKLVEPAAVLDQLREGGGVAAAVVVLDAFLHGVGPELEDVVHRPHVLGANLDAVVAAGAVPDAAVFAELAQARPVVCNAEEPQLEVRQEQRSDRVPSWHSRTSIRESRTVADGCMSRA